MRILIIGGNGTIGRRVTEYFRQSDEVTIAGRSSGDVVVDISDSSSIERMFKTEGTFDAVVNIAGEAKWGLLTELTEEDFHLGLRSKLMGQVNLVRIGLKYLNAGGSITLSSGILADDPVVMTSSAALVNGGIHSFVQAAALEIDNGLRVNVVSSGVVADAFEKYREFFPGHNPIPMHKVVNAYVRSVRGKGHGEIIRVYE